MCDCLQTIAEEKSKQYAKNGKDACVQTTITGEIRIKQFVIDNDYRKGKILRRSKYGKYENIEFNYCPICGQPNKDYQFAQVWHD